MNKPKNYILALVEVPVDRSFAEGDVFAVREATGSYHIPGDGCAIRYVWQPFEATSDWADIGSVKDWRKLWDRGMEPQRHGEHRDGVG